MRISPSLVFGVAFLCLVTYAAHADTSAIRSENNAIWIAGGESLFSYQESVTPLPDSEHGWLGSVAGGASMMTNNNIYLDLDGSVNWGDAHYNGAYFNAPATSLQGTTSESITNIDGKVGKGFPLGGMVMLTPYLDLGYRYWDRNLGAGQTEDYQNFDSLGGLMFQIAPISKLVLTAYGAVGTTFGSKMTTDSTDFDLGSAGVYKAGFKAGYLVIPKLEVFGTLDYDHFRYAQSQPQYDATINGYAQEPGSHTEDTALRLGVAYHFK